MGQLATKATWILAGDIGVRIIGFLTTVYLARTFGADGYGLIVIGLSVLGVCLWFADLGLNTLGTREVSKKPNHTYSENQIFSAKAFMAVISFAGGSFFIWIIFYDNRTTAIMLQLFLLALIPHSIQIEWLYNGLQKFSRITYSRILQASLYLILLFFLTGPDNLIYVPVFYTFSVLIAAIFLLTLYKKRKNLNPFKTDHGHLGILISDGFRLGLGSLFAQFVILLPPLFIGYFLGNSQAGYYGAAFKLILLVMLLDRMITTLLLPNLSRIWKKKKKDVGYHLNSLLKLATAFSCAAALLLYYGADVIINLIFGEGYNQSAFILPILSFFLPATFVNSIFSYGLIATGHDSDYLMSATRAGIGIFFLLLFVSFIGNLSWIAFAVVLSEVTIMLFMYTAFSKVVDIEIQTPMLQIAIFMILLMSGTLFSVNQYLVSSLVMPALYLLILYTFKILHRQEFNWLIKRLFS